MENPMSRTATQTTIGAADAPRRSVGNLPSVPTTAYRTVSVDGLKVFYREAGNPQSQAVLLLHGFPTSSHMYRELIPALADRYHVVAPDLPGFGFTEAPNRKTFKYTFDHLAEVIERFTEVLGLSRYVLYVFDYGAPVGFRLALSHPERVTALISQNGNAYEEGLSEGWNPIQAYWKNPSPENRSALRAFLTPETTQWQYTHGAANPERLSPDAWTLDSALLARPGKDEIQLDLFGDYKSKVALYPKFRVLPHSAASATRGLGQERSLLSACRVQRGCSNATTHKRSPSIDA
jgi:pimeloyl-ACP methyl ester carboxylesterase